MQNGNIILFLWNLVLKMLDSVRLAWDWLTNPNFFLGIEFLNWTIYKGPPLGLITGAGLLILVGWWIFRG